jgi:hypothetical protein
MGSGIKTHRGESAAWRSALGGGTDIGNPAGHISRGRPAINEGQRTNVSKYQLRK